VSLAEATTLKVEYEHNMMKRSEAKTNRIQSRRLFFFKNFLVRYFRYLFEKGIPEATVIFVLPVGSLEGTNLIEKDDHTVPRDFNIVAKLSCFAIYLDAIVKEFFKVCTIKDPIGCRLRVVNNEPVLCNGSLRNRMLRLGSQCKPTEKGTQQSDELTMAGDLVD